MAIQILDQDTINQIAAGEVVERPASVVKELMENAIDAGATAVTVEIRQGGIGFIRITDNGCGIPKEELPLAFLRHSTSKIHSAADLLTVASLGFRGEALSSIAAVSQVELITKTTDSLTGSRYRIEGGEEKGLEEVGAPEGTTFISRNLFFNTPARRKFLRTETTEAGHVADLVEKIALSHPEISIRLIVNNQNRLHTSGNHNLKDIIYTIYGREIAGNLLSVSEEREGMQISGFIGKPVIARGNRNFENYFINGRYIKSRLISKAIEDGYKSYMMQHKYPFTLLHFTIEPELIDVNVHPSKMELRFKDGEAVYQMVYHAVTSALSGKELIPTASLPEPKVPNQPEVSDQPESQSQPEVPGRPEPFEKKRMEAMGIVKEPPSPYGKEPPVPPSAEEKKEEQLELFDGRLLSEEARKRHRLIGQVFDTYWLVEYDGSLYIIDQHAAHEKVLFEQNFASLKSREYTSQYISPPIILSLSMREAELLNRSIDVFRQVGFEIEPFGGSEFAVRAVPGNLLSLAKKELLMEMIDSLSEEGGRIAPESVYDRIATMSCKAAVKGNTNLSFAEADQLIDSLLKLENPYQCPHGRPTIISISKYEMEKKFKRIV
ncbi:MAG TPA: DNA mismatch repair endonuclease MutL [Candidatus Copromonas avistercoris]|nr:DNA mismatch repair endonuclease MutL [Candidatus Copromonas avistercoris]